MWRTELIMIVIGLCKSDKELGFEGSWQKCEKRGLGRGILKQARL